jgi:hypothetical protein
VLVCKGQHGSDILVNYPKIKVSLTGRGLRKNNDGCREEEKIPWGTTKSVCSPTYALLFPSFSSGAELPTTWFCTSLSLSFLTPLTVFFSSFIQFFIFNKQN